MASAACYHPQFATWDTPVVFILCWSAVGCWNLYFFQMPHMHSSSHPANCLMLLCKTSVEWGKTKPFSDAMGDHTGKKKISMIWWAAFIVWFTHWLGVGINCYHRIFDNSYACNAVFSHRAKYCGICLSYYHKENEKSEDPCLLSCIAMKNFFTDQREHNLL